MEAAIERERVADDLERLIDTANAPIFGIDVHGRVNEWNQTAAKISGYSKEETMGKRLVAEFITPEYRASVQAVLTKALRGDETANYEFPLFTKGGARVEVLLNATTRRSATGVVTGVVGVGQDITQLRNVTNELQRVADDLTRLIDTANAPIFGIDVEGRVNEWNQKAAQISGFAKEETMGKLLVEGFIRPEYRNSVQTVLKNALRGVETDNYAFPLFTKQGQRVEVLLNATTRRDAAGEVIGAIGVGQDITELRKVTAERMQVAGDLERLIDTANAPIFGIDVHGMVTEWNQRAAAISGYAKTETMGRRLVSEFITPDYRDSVNRVLKNALRGIETSNYEFPLFTKEGKRVDVLLNATSRRSASGNIIGVVGVGQDITELKRVATERERVADDLERLIDTANAPIFGIDVHGRVNEWNQRAAAISGYTKEETMGKRLVEEFISPEFRASVEAVLDKALHGVETANYEFPLFTKGGARVDVLLNATTRRSVTGVVTGVVGVGQDITRLRAKEQEALEAKDRAAALQSQLADEKIRVAKVALWQERVMASHKEKELSDKLHFMRLKPMWKISQEQLKCIDNDTVPLIATLRRDEARATEQDPFGLNGGGAGGGDLADSYSRRFRLGKGSFGSVYLGRWHGIPVAVKHCRALPAAMTSTRAASPQAGSTMEHPAMIYFEQPVESSAADRELFSIERFAQP